MKTVRVKTDFGIICFDENGVFTVNRMYYKRPSLAF